MKKKTLLANVKNVYFSHIKYHENLPKPMPHAILSKCKSSSSWVPSQWNEVEVLR
jgi:hypothetical protein